jgi:cytoplasmic iron level regulating protein YaaA (DUF328/UPF0246 family)
MIVVLPPSETKRDGGTNGAALDLGSLSFLEVTDQRGAVLRSLEALCVDADAASVALGLGPRQLFEVERNRAVLSAPTMPAIERYTGVLFDALEVESLDEHARAWVDRSVFIHSALFGLLRPADLVPAYRLSHSSKLPGLSMGPTWRTALTAVLLCQTGLLLDLRSESYAKLGPVTSRPNSFYLRIVTHTPDGTKKAVTHFNKAGKGAFVRALAVAEGDHESVESLLGWARAAGIPLALGAPGVLELAV